MLYDGRGQIRLTKSERRRLNLSVGPNNRSFKETEIAEASLKALPDELIQDMTEFLETGSSKLSREGAIERAANCGRNKQ